LKAAIVLALVVLTAMAAWIAIGPQLLERTETDASRFDLVLGSRKIGVQVRPDPATPGENRFRFDNWPEQGRQWLPEQTFATLLAAEAHRLDDRPRLLKLLSASTWLASLWVGLGLVGQIVFVGRMIVQWWSSERCGRSIVTPAFWWMSMVGSAMLLTYFIWRKDPVGILGQSTGVVIYLRNISIMRAACRSTPEPAPETKPEPRAQGIAA
jgi:lipid-A-disaccharide synthase-like uncharacterized protein